MRAQIKDICKDTGTRAAYQRPIKAQKQAYDNWVQ